MVQLDSEAMESAMLGGGASPTVSTIRLYGDDDDHLRAVVSLSLAFNEAHRDLARECRDPRNNPWPRRLAALRELLRVAARKGRSLDVRVEDPDALDRGPLNDRRRWDDAHFARQRGELLDVLLNAAINDGLLILTRTNPRRRIDFRLQRSVIHEENLECVRSVGAPERVAGVSFSSTLAPIARWLLNEGVMADVDLVALDEIHGASEVLVAAWERFKSSVRRDAMRLCTVREPMHRNGTMGPFAWAALAGRDARVAVSSNSVTELASAGFLQPSTRSGDLHMPREVRHFVDRHARQLAPVCTRSLHGDLAALDELAVPTQGAGRTMEAHWHAVAAQDVDRALATASYYGADVRAVAIQLGRSAHRLRRNEGRAIANPVFERAASVFEKIVSDFDREDAYAWEYAAYNRWQLHRFAPAAMSTAQREKVSMGFERACHFDARNPLFRGRLLAYQVDCGEEIGAEFNRWMRAFLDQFGAHDRTAAERLTWFAEPVLGALRRKGGGPIGEFTARWPVLREVQARIEQRNHESSDAVEADG